MDFKKLVAFGDYEDKMEDSPIGDAPITKVVLLKSGLVQLERCVEVEGDAKVDMYFRSSEFAAAYESLSVTDEHGHLATISYDGESENTNDAPPRLPPFDGSLLGIWESNRGMQVTVRAAGKEVSGLIVGCHDKPKEDDDCVVECIVVLTDENKLTPIPLCEVEDIQLPETSNLRSILHRTAHPPPKKSQHKKVEIQTKGEGKRLLKAQYSLMQYSLNQVGWGISYRIRLPQGQPAYGVTTDFSLQGWAEIENKLSDHWKDVTLTLLGSERKSGACSTALSADTQLLNMSVTVKTAGKQFTVLVKANDLVVDLKRQIAKEMGFPPVSQVILYGGRALDDYSNVNECGIQDGCAVLLYVRQQQQDVGDEKGKEPVAPKSKKRGEVFQFTLPYKITLNRGQIARVPVIDKVLVGRYVVFHKMANGYSNPSVAQATLVLTNSTSDALEGGPLTLDTDDSAEPHSTTLHMNSLRTQEEFFIPLEPEPGCIVVPKAQTSNLGIHALKVDQGEIRFVSTSLRKVTYTLHNKIGGRVEFFVEHPRSKEWELLELASSYELVHNGKALRFCHDVGGDVVEFTVRERRLDTESSFVKDLKRDVLDGWKESGKIDEPSFLKLSEVVDLDQKREDIADSIHVREMEVSELLANQERFKANITVLASGAAADKTGYQQYAKELSETEAKLLPLQEQLRKLKSEQEVLVEKFKTQCSDLKIKVTYKFFDPASGTLVPLSEKKDSVASSAASAAGSEFDMV